MTIPNPPVFSQSILMDYQCLAEADGALDKTRRHKKRQLEDTLHLVMKKRKVGSFSGGVLLISPWRP
jgi:hypothetical protein